MARQLPSLADYPIPRDVAPGPGWCAMMGDMASHIGAYDTLAICEALGGRDVYVPADAERSPFVETVGRDKARTLAWAYRGETLAIPTAGVALARARRGPVLAAIRAGRLTVTDGARIMGVRRDYASRLVNKTSEGAENRPAHFAPKPADPRQLDMFR